MGEMTTTTTTMTNDDRTRLKNHTLKFNKEGIQSQELPILNSILARVDTVDLITPSFESGSSSSLLKCLLYSFIGVLLEHSLGGQEKSEKCLPTRAMFAICIRQNISRARKILCTESLHRTGTASVSNIKQEPTSTRIGATKLLLVLAPSIYIGGWLGKNLAEFLDEWSIFYPECDDDEDD